MRFEALHGRLGDTWATITGRFWNAKSSTQSGCGTLTRPTTTWFAQSIGTTSLGDKQGDLRDTISGDV